MSTAGTPLDPTDWAATETARVRVLRAWLRVHSPGPSRREVIGRVSYQVYVVLLMGGLWGTAVYTTLTEPITRPPALPARVEQVVPAVAAGLAFLLTATGARIGTWAGPLLVSRPQAALLLPAPLDRRALFGRTLGLGLAGYGVVGGVVGLAVAVVVAVEARVAPWATIGGTVLAWTALGVVTGAGALAVESSQRLARIALRATPVLALAGIGQVWLSVTSPTAAAWATPWGWAAAPITAGVGTEVPLDWAPPLMLTVAAVVAVVLAVRRLPAVPDEELVRRAGTATDVRRSASLFDARAIAQARRSGQRRLLGVRHVRIPRPRRRWLLVVWRDTVSLLRRPGLVERTVVVVAAVAVLVAWASGGIAAIAVAAVAVHLAAGQLLVPLRIELEDPVVRVLTGFTARDVALEHLVVPFLGMTVASVLAAVGLGATGFLPWSALPAALLGAVVVAAICTATAGLTSTRGAPPLQLLLRGQGGIGMLMLWVLAGPILALVVVLPLGVGVASALRAGADPMAATV
ncbi:MAG TPA: DUF6297 family protein, partial [Nitriliruptoraceae bacterium]|nr:DUF6297 family protein [Nitriliruptoraceae bacterium]